MYTGVGMPLYGEKSYPKKNLFIPSHRACPPLTRPGYFDKGSPNVTVGVLIGYRLREVEAKDWLKLFCLSN
jgi:hypothetical protein